jgi:Holliday junction resolvasome RuvABC endonuclease subunit
MSEKKYYLYGLDISLKCTGVSIYDIEEKRFVYIGSFNTEKIRATKEYRGLHLNALKLKKLADWFKEIIKEYPPYIVAIERMFSRFPTETQVIAKATGVMQCMLWNKPQFLYPPKTVKKEIINGNASKALVKSEILKRYPELEMKNEDESDAVAVALCHLIQTGMIEWEK